MGFRGQGRMSCLRLSPEMIAAGYEFLRSSPPFKGWRLPPADEIEFAVTRTRDRSADFQWPASRDEHPRICISERSCALTVTLLALLAHEMTHLKHYLRRTDRPDVQHTAQFRKDWERVCRIHGFDRTTGY